MGRVESSFSEGTEDDPPSMAQDASQRVASIPLPPVVGSSQSQEENDDEERTAVASDNSSAGLNPLVICKEIIQPEDTSKPAASIPVPSVVRSSQSQERASDDEEHTTVAPDHSSSGLDPPVVCEEIIKPEGASERVASASVPQVVSSSQPEEGANDNEEHTAVASDNFSSGLNPPVLCKEIIEPEDASKRVASIPVTFMSSKSEQNNSDDEHQTVSTDTSSSSGPDYRANWKQTFHMASKHRLQGRVLMLDFNKRPCRLVSCVSWRTKFLGIVLLLVIFSVLPSQIGISTTPNNMEVTLEMSSLAPSDTTIGESSASSPQTEPSSTPSESPSLAPSSSIAPSDLPSFSPSLSPSDLLSQVPSLSPTAYENEETIFYAIGDVPYKDVEKIQLRDRMIHLPDNGEFLVHVGDIRSAKNKTVDCQLEEYQAVRDILLESKIPVFIIPGDNEWKDCPNYAEAKSFWRETFREFERNWDHSFQVVRHPSEPENFYFIHKRTLYFGLNLVGGKIRGYGSHSSQLRYLYEVVKSTINKYVVAGGALNVVIFGHAFPAKIHRKSFFRPFKAYVEADLNNTVPIMYLNGDKHFYQSEENYMGLSNFHRLQVDYGTIKPPLKVVITSSSSPGWNANDAFAHDRMLSLML